MAGTKITIEPVDSAGTVPTRELIDLVQLGCDTLIFDTAGGRMPRILKIVKEGSTIVVKFTN